METKEKEVETNDSLVEKVSYLNLKGLLVFYFLHFTLWYIVIQQARPICFADLIKLLATYTVFTIINYIPLYKPFNNVYTKINLVLRKYTKIGVRELEIIPLVGFMSSITVLLTYSKSIDFGITTLQLYIIILVVILFYYYGVRYLNSTYYRRLYIALLWMTFVLDVVFNLTNILDPFQFIWTHVFTSLWFLSTIPLFIVACISQKWHLTSYIKTTVPRCHVSLEIIVTIAAILIYFFSLIMSGSDQDQTTDISNHLRKYYEFLGSVLLIWVIVKSQNVNSQGNRINNIAEQFVDKDYPPDENNNIISTTLTVNITVPKMESTAVKDRQMSNDIPTKRIDQFQSKQSYIVQITEISSEQISNSN